MLDSSASFWNFRVIRRSVSVGLERIARISRTSRRSGRIFCQVCNRFEFPHIMVMSRLLQFNICSFLCRLGMKCPENYNLSDFVISKITARPPSILDSENDEKRIEALVEKYRSSKLHEQLVADQYSAVINKVCYYF